MSGAVNYAKTYTLSYKDVAPTNCLSLLNNILTKEEKLAYEFTPYAWAKINAYINLIGDLEITGLGKIEDDKITDIAILKQRVTSTHADCPETAISDFLRSIPIEEAQLWKLDWHSHVNMATSPSPTDEGNYRAMSQIRMGQPFPFIIINKQHSIYAANYYGNGYTKRIQISYPKLITEKDIKDVYKICKEDITKFCREEVRTYTGYPQSYNYTNSVYYNDYADYVDYDKYSNVDAESDVEYDNQSDAEYAKFLEEQEENEYIDYKDNDQEFIDPVDRQVWNGY